MRTKLNLTVAGLILALLSILGLQPSSTQAQGSLTPPGAPGATMRTLSQVEPRTPISSAPFTITQSGSYYLATNIVCTVSNAIVIATNGVTLDLNGFTISSTVPNAVNGGSAILLGNVISDITIQNGHIRGGVVDAGGVYSGGGFSYGIYYSGNAPRNVLVSHLTVSGCLSSGIYLDSDDSTVVESCIIQTVGGYGIFASEVKQSSAFDCGSTAIYSYYASDCRGESSAYGDGVYAYTALNCYGTTVNGNDGVDGYYCAQNCYGSCSSSYGDGVYSTSALNCTGFSSGTGAGVAGFTTQNCYGQNDGNGSGVYGNTVQNCYGGTSGSGYGIYAYYLATGCFGSSYGTGLYAFMACFSHGIGTTTGISTSHNVYSY